MNECKPLDDGDDDRDRDSDSDDGEELEPYDMSDADEDNDGEVAAAMVGRCRLTPSKPVLQAPLV